MITTTHATPNTFPVLKYFKIVFFICFGFLISLNGFAQPSNDDPCNALPLTLSANCTFNMYTTGDATGSTIGDPGCADYQGGDVWFSVVVPADGNITFDTRAADITDGAMAVYTGDCTNLTLLECDDDDSDNGLMPSITRTGLTPGSTIYVRIWSFGNAESGTFEICAFIPPPPPPPPANDECSGAISLTVNPDQNCGVVTQATTVNATQSAGTTPSCFPNGINDDVWFSFVATSTSHTIDIENISGSGDMIIQVYSGDCNNLVAKECSDPEFMVTSNLVIGQTYFVRVWTWSSTATTRSTFNICVGTLPPPPANDDCAGAVSLTVNPDLLCGSVTAGSTSSATQSAEIAATCGASGTNDDVWYTFVATNSSHVVSLLNVTGSSTDMAMAVYSGACGSLVSLQCSDPNTMFVSGLTVGSTYTVRVWTWTANSGSFASFDICVGTPPPPPANDDPCNAFLLTLDYECVFTDYHNSSATPSANIPAPGCANYSGGDVWFKVVVPCEGAISLDTRPGVVTDGGMAVYSGTCSNMVLIDCDDDGSANGLMPAMNFQNLTPGDTLWIRVWEYGNDNQGTFGICANIPPPPSSGVACTTAQPFCTSNTYTVPNTSGQPSLGGNGVYGCLGSTPNPAWYFMQVQTAGDIIIGISQEDANGDGLDVDYAVWGPFSSAAAACTGISANNIISCSFDPAPVETATITGAQPGQFYMILLTNYSDEPGTITFQQTGGTGQSSCAALCDIPATNSGPVCVGSPFNLATPGFSGATYLWTGPRCFTSTDQNPTGVIAPNLPGTYFYYLTATDAAGNSCYGVTEVIVLGGPKLGRDSTINACSGTTLNLNDLYDTQGLTFEWTFNGAVVANYASVDVPGTYQLIAANSNGCADTVLVNWSTHDVVATATATNANCTDMGTVTVNVSQGIAPFGYTISNNPSVIVPGNEILAPEGTYTISVIDSAGCETTTPVTVGFTDNLELNTIDDTGLCSGSSVVLATTSNGTDFNWTPVSGLDDPTAMSPTASPSIATTYSVTATLGSCVRSEDVVLTIINGLTADAGPDREVNAGNSITINGSATGNYTNILWEPSTNLSATNTLTPTFTPTTISGTTTYTLTVSNDEGCVATDQVDITIIPSCIKVRNAFTPNGDGNNDLWRVYDDYNCLGNVTVHVFNRYGNKVFESRDYRNTWDGTYKGKPVPDGTYYAVINFRLTSGMLQVVKTDLTILR